VVAPTTLEELACAMAVAFAQVAGRLSDVRGALLDLCGRLGDLDRILEGHSGNVRVLTVVETGAELLRIALNEGSTVAAPDRVTRSVVTSRTQLAEIIAHTKHLDAVASLTLITARSLNLPGFDSYVSDLRSLSARVRDDAGHLEVAVSALRKRRETAAQLYGQAGHSLDQVLGVFSRVADERATTEVVLARSLTEVAALATRLPEVAAAETAGLVRAMQLADTRATGTDVAAALDRIAAQASTAADVLSARGGLQASPAAQALQLGRKILSEVAEGARLTLTAVDATAAEAETPRQLSDEASLRFASLVQATDQIHLAAINAVLLTRREDGQERTMTVLSSDVQQQAAACAAASSGCRTAIEQLSVPDDLKAFGTVAERGGAFRRAVGETEAAVDTAGSAMAELDRLRDIADASLQRLSAAAADAHQALVQLGRATDELSILAGSLPVSIPDGSSVLDDLMELYTMESEREVHRRLFGIAEPTVPAAVPADTSVVDDPLAAILF
jgi:hypothetical protein